MNLDNTIASNKPVRILQVTGGMNIGGAETMLMHLYRKADRSKVQFDFISFTNQRCHFDNEIYSMGGRIFFVSPPKEMNLFKFISDIYAIIKQYGPYHAVHAHTLFNSGLTLLAARLAKVKIRVCHSHNTQADFNRIFIRRIYFILMKVLIKLNANKFVSCTLASGKFLFGKKVITQKKCNILYNAIDLLPYKFIDNEAVMEIRQKLGVNSNTLVIGHVGRFGEQKNHVFLIRLAEYLKNNQIDFILILIGEGDLKSKIENLVKDKDLESNIKLLGKITNIHLYMRMFDVFVFPSLYEGLGIVLIEAQAAGTPCIISDNVPCESDMGLGLVYKLSLDDQLKNWCNTILKAYKEKKISLEMTTKIIMQNGYDLSRTIKDLYKIYEIE